VLGAALISAWDPGALAKPNAAADQALLAEFRADVGPLAGTTAEALLAEARSNAAAWSLLNVGSQWGRRPLIITEADDFLGANDAAIAEALRKAHIA